jgi:hypothetical protein
MVKDLHQDQILREKVGIKYVTTAENANAAR